MEHHEGIDKMYCRFNDVIKNLEVLGNEYSLGKKNRKYSNALLEEWETNAMTIK